MLSERARKGGNRQPGITLPRNAAASRSPREPSACDFRPPLVLCRLTERFIGVVIAGQMDTDSRSIYGAAPGRGQGSGEPCKASSSGSLSH